MSTQDILNVIDKWVSEGSGWAINHIDSHYKNVTTYKPLHGSSYIELPMELRNPKKGLINIKNTRQAERASNLTFSKYLHLVDLNNPRILMMHDKIVVTTNMQA